MLPRPACLAPPDNEDWIWASTLKLHTKRPKVGTCAHGFSENHKKVRQIVMAKYLCVIGSSKKTFGHYWSLVATGWRPVRPAISRSSCWHVGMAGWLQRSQRPVSEMLAGGQTFRFPGCQESMDIYVFIYVYSIPPKEQQCISMYIYTHIHTYNNNQYIYNYSMYIDR